MSGRVAKSSSSVWDIVVLAEESPMAREVFDPLVISTLVRIARAARNRTREHSFHCSVEKFLDGTCFCGLDELSDAVDALDRKITPRPRI